MPSRFECLTQSPLALITGDSYPPRIRKDYVHKFNAHNVLVSTPHQTGSMYWFNMFNASQEFNFDHRSDHMQGMLLIEGLRQSSIAAAHLVGFPLLGIISLLSFDISFLSYVEQEYPVLTRVFPYASRYENGGIMLFGFVIAQIFQQGRLCAESLLTGYCFSSAESYAETRQRTHKIIARRKNCFEQEIKRNLPSHGAE